MPAPYPPSSNVHVSSPRRSEHGFALLVTITLVAFLVLILVSLAAFTRIETQVATNAQTQATARNNALVGLQVALGELQRHAGADQRVTTPATTVYPRKDVVAATGELFDLYRARAQTAPRNTYLTPAERTQWEADLRDWWGAGNRNPHWTAVFDSSLRRDATTAGKYGEFKRDQLPLWLVSGNERPAVSFDPATATSYPVGYFTPDVDPATIDGVGPDDIVELVGAGSATEAADSVDGLSGSVRVVRQALEGIPPGHTAPQTIGHYAYWVGDENTKANFSIRDPWFSSNAPATPEYRNRLQVPQRIGWERIEGLREVFDAGSGLSVNDERFLKVLSREQIAFLDQDFAAPLKRAFHHLTAHSRSLHTDTALGGLKKDLTVFIEGSGSGISATDPIFDRSLYAANDPRFGTSNTGFPANSSTNNLPRWGQIKDWSDSTATGSTSTLPVAAGRAPVLANYQVFYGFSREGNTIQMHWVPCVVLWNPYDVGLASTTYRLGWRHSPAFWRVGVATRDMVDPTPADTDDGQIIPTHPDFLSHRLRGLDWYDSTAPNYKNFGMSLGGAPWSTAGGGAPNYQFAPFDTGASLPTPDSSASTWVTYEFTSGFDAGQTKVFTVGAPQKITASAAHDGTAVIQLENTFDSDFPESWFFDFAEIDHPAVIADGEDVRFHMLARTGLAASTPSMELRLQGGTVLWRNEYMDHIGSGWSRSIIGTGTGAATVENPNTWRPLMPLAQWQAEPKNFDSNQLGKPLIALWRGYVQPFSEARAYHSANDMLMTTGNTTRQRAFALYNLAAPSLSLDTAIEGARYFSPSNNIDLFSNNSLLTIDNNTSSAGFRWDENHTAVNGSATEGFTLLTWIPTTTRQPLSRLELRRVNRPNSNILSLGQFQQANLSHLAWQPGFPVGNSEASPYVDRARVAGIESYDVGSGSTSTYSSSSSWWSAARSRRPNTADNRYLDVSYLLNENLWDRHFLSSIPQTGAVSLDNSTPLANSRHRFTGAASTLAADDVRDFDTSAAWLENFGALNVNSTSVEAWKSLLTAFRGLGYASNDNRTGDDRTNAIPVSRTLDPSGGNLRFTFAGKNNTDVGATSANRDYTKFFTGFRHLTDDMIQALAERIVDEVRLRGPFYSVADFVNRRLVSPDRSGSDAWLTARTTNQSAKYNQGGVHAYGVDSSHISYGESSTIDADYDAFTGLAGINGALQRAINVSGINGGMNYPLPYDVNDRAFRIQPDILQHNTQPMQMYAMLAHYLDSEHLAGVPTGEVGSLLSHSPGFVTSADILSMIGPALTARGDTFLIRTYGDAINPATGEIAGRAWLEAVVQRTIEPLTPAGTTGDARFQPADEFGRRFTIVSLRWLGADDL